MHDEQFAAAVHGMQLRQQGVQSERSLQRLRCCIEGGEVRERAACRRELEVANGGHGGQAIQAAAQDHEHEAPAGGRAAAGEAQRGRWQRGRHREGRTHEAAA